MNYHATTILTRPEGVAPEVWARATYAQKIWIINNQPLLAAAATRQHNEERAQWGLA